MEPEPKFYRELAHVAWHYLKILLGIGVPYALLLALYQTHPWLALGLMYFLMIGGGIFFSARMTYKSKKKDWEREKQREAQQKEWDEARERLRRQA